MLSKIGNWIVEFAAKVSLVSGMVLISILALFTTAYVIMRALGMATFGFYEIILLIIVAFVLIGPAYTEKTGGHVRLDFLAVRFPAKMQVILRSLGLLLGIVMFSIVSWRFVIYTYALWEKGTYYRGMVNLPYWPSYVIMCLGAILFVIVLISHFIQSMRESIACFRQPTSMSDHERTDIDPEREDEVTGKEE